MFSKLKNFSIPLTRNSNIRLKIRDSVYNRILSEHFLIYEFYALLRPITDAEATSITNNFAE